MKKVLLAEVPEELNQLRAKSEAVKTVDKDIRQLVADMFDSLRADNGIGLSAPQLGVLKRVIIAEYEDDHAHNASHSDSGKQPARTADAIQSGGNSVPRTALINPEIIWASKKEKLDEEGCLSFPNLYGMVKRPERIRYRALDEAGKQIEKKVDGLLARVIQHEIDHLNGILFVDRAEGGLYKYEKRVENGE